MKNDKFAEMNRAMIGQRVLDEIATELRLSRKGSAARREAKWKELQALVNQQMEAFESEAVLGGLTRAMSTEDLESHIPGKDNGR